MNMKLETIRDKFIEQVKLSENVLGAWNFGSETRGLSDEYSDADIVLLIEGEKFIEFSGHIEGYLKNICEDILLCWPENFNSEAIINNGYLLSYDKSIFQFDVFLLNSERLDDFICRIHYSELSENNIIFDKNGFVKALALLKPAYGCWNGDIERLEKTYWYHAYMTGKYIIRKDFFKMHDILHIMYETHASMLLIGFDKITWGGPANKLHFIPKDNQEHLKKYYCSEDFSQIKNNLINCMKNFQSDSKTIRELKGMDYSAALGDAIMTYFVKEIS